MAAHFQPFPYQQPMIDHLIDNERAALFVVPGSGKTVCTLTAIDALATVGQLTAALIVAPVRVCSITWPAQIEHWEHTRWMRVAQLRTKAGMQSWHDQEADIYLINSELLPSRLPLMFPRGCKSSPVDTLVIDELSLFKSPKSVRGKALIKYAAHFPRRWGLTGTPVPNTYLDLFQQAKLLDGGERLGKSYFTFRREFFNSDYMGYNWSEKPDTKATIDGKLSDLALVVSDGIHLPASSIVDVPVDMPAEAKRQYRTLEKQLLADIAGGEVTAPSAATLCGKLLQMTSGAVYDAERNVLPVHDAKIDAVTALAARHAGEPILVLTAYKHEAQRILAAMPAARMFDERDLPAWQAGRIPVWVADPRSLSHGIDGIQRGGRIAVWCSLTYSAETYAQTNARLIRTGQARDTLIYRLVCPNTIDEAVIEALRDKSATQSGFLAAVRALQRLRTA